MDNSGLLVRWSNGSAIDRHGGNKLFSAQPRAMIKVGYLSEETVGQRPAVKIASFCFARDHRAVSVVFQIAPDAMGDWERQLGQRGATPSGSWVTFAGTVTLTPAGTIDLRMDVLEPDLAVEFARVMCVGFGRPSRVRLRPGSAGCRRNRRLGSGRTVRGTATGLLRRRPFVANGIGVRAVAATLPEYRRRGAHGALMARRMRDAAEPGCEWVTSEIGSETQDNPNPSLHGMRRMGLPELYERRNWIWRAPD